MGWIQDLLSEVPLSAVLKQRVALAEQKYEAAVSENATLKQRVSALEDENTALRALVPKKQEGELGEDTTRVLLHLFRVQGEARDVNAMAQALKMEPGVMLT